MASSQQNLLNINNSTKKVQKQLNIDLKLLYNLLLANKISLNSKKTEMVIFHRRNCKVKWRWNVRLNGYKLTQIRLDQIRSNQISRIIPGQTINWPLPI